MSRDIDGAARLRIDAAAMFPDIDSATMTELVKDHAYNYGVSLYWEQAGKTGAAASYLLDAVPATRNRMHREEHLEKYDVKSRTVSRCYNVGSEVWRRKDGGDLTERDVQSLQTLSYGQGKRLTKLDAKNVQFNWECDSSD